MKGDDLLEAAARPSWPSAGRASISRGMSVAGPPHPLTLQMLTWLSSQPRTYAETMQAWRTSCPRLSIWEDALADQLIHVGRAHPGGGQGAAPVRLTNEGRELLTRFA